MRNKEKRSQGQPVVVMFITNWSWRRGRTLDMWTRHKNIKNRGENLIKDTEKYQNNNGNNFKLTTTTTIEDNKFIITLIFNETIRLIARLFFRFQVNQWNLMRIELKHWENYNKNKEKAIKQKGLKKTR